MIPRIVELRTKILKKNDELARELRQRFAESGVLVVNVVSGTGAGKTELLTRTLRALGERYGVAAVVGDLATDNDAARLAKSGAWVKQILTGTMCHLEADMVQAAIAAWDLHEIDFLMIENVGNLVCPASWDLGEDVRVLLCSATEGEDKPLKYPTLINTVDLVMLSKMDLAAAVEFDVQLAEANIQRARPGVPTLRISAKTGQGIDAWLEFLEARFREKQNGASTAGQSGAHLETQNTFDPAY
jgi:hydrogenase nickel incorporation protein HypB